MTENDSIHLNRSQCVYDSSRRSSTREPYNLGIEKVYFSVLYRVAKPTSKLIFKKIRTLQYNAVSTKYF